MNQTQPSTKWRVHIEAGTGEPGYFGDGSSAAKALLNNPFDLAFAPDGSFFPIRSIIASAASNRAAASYRPFVALGSGDFPATAKRRRARN
jgi:hypothetical protein